MDTIAIRRDPDKHLRLSMAEVKRRAGLGEALLRNERHHDLRLIVQDWLYVQKQSFATSKAAGRKVKRDTIQFYEDALQKTSSEAKSWIVERARLEKERADLETGIERIHRSRNMVGIKSRRTE